MQDKSVLGKSISKWIEDFPIIEKLCDLQEIMWINPDLEEFEKAIKSSPLSQSDILDASERLKRFADYFKVAFEETKKTNGLLESPLQSIPKMKAELSKIENIDIQGKLLIKLDSHLPISGSIKARGGIYEVLKLAEDIAIKEGLLKTTDNYSVLNTEKFKKLFSKYSVAVGSTGNLGLSIGIISAKLGFEVTVHMSADAKQWKKDMLRSKGVIVKEYESDYSVAVEQGRKETEGNEYCHFVDDENSTTLFLGYAVAALRLKEQFLKDNIVVDKENPLFVYLPCGVGGGPGGVAFGLKVVFGDNVHCFFAEPTNSSCMILGMATGENNNVCVQDFGISNKTDADGLAVGRASGFVGKLMRPFIRGCYTVTDDRMYKHLSVLKDTENIELEPSALAAMQGAVYTESSQELTNGIDKSKITHLVWATGGSMVPKEVMNEYYIKGKSL